MRLGVLTIDRWGGIVLCVAICMGTGAFVCQDAECGRHQSVEAKTSNQDFEQVYLYAIHYKLCYTTVHTVAFAWLITLDSPGYHQQLGSIRGVARDFPPSKSPKFQHTTHMSIRMAMHMSIHILYTCLYICLYTCLYICIQMSCPCVCP